MNHLDACSRRPLVLTFWKQTCNQEISTNECVEIKKKEVYDAI